MYTHEVKVCSTCGKEREPVLIGCDCGATLSVYKKKTIDNCPLCDSNFISFNSNAGYDSFSIQCGNCGIGVQDYSWKAAIPIIDKWNNLKRYKVTK